MHDDPKIEWLRAYISRAKQGAPYAPNIKAALMDMLDLGMTAGEVQRLTGCAPKTLYSFMDQRRRASAELRRAERGKAEDRETRAKALADRDARLRLMAGSCIEVDLLGGPPPGRSALDLRRKLDAAE